MMETEIASTPLTAMHIRPLVAADATQYRALMLQAYALAADAFTSTPAEREAEPLGWWVARIGGPAQPGQAFGAFVSGQLVGTVAVEYAEKPKTRHKGLVIGMYVAQSCRGLGAGRALLSVAVAAATARPGVLMLTLTVTQGNAAAIRLYEAAGFQSFGVEPMAIFTGTDYKAKVHMYLLLDRPDGTGIQKDPLHGTA
jgi:RimJ/RimL family protein N-acetyltransferase